MARYITRRDEEDPSTYHVLDLEAGNDLASTIVESFSGVVEDGAGHKGDARTMALECCAELNREHLTGD